MYPVKAVADLGFTIPLGAEIKDTYPVKLQYQNQCVFGGQIFKS
jgi:hypothetical protein